MIVIVNICSPAVCRYYPILAPGAKIFPLTVSTENLDGVTPLNLIGGYFSIVGSGVAATASMRAMLDFAARHGVKPQIEKFPMTLTGVKDAMQKLRDGKMRYRGVLVAA